MRNGRRAEIAARAFLTLATLVPYWRLLTFAVVYVTDDYFASDIFNGELPGRVLIGGMIRGGQLPVWTTGLCSGVPLAGFAADPIGLSTFALLRPAAALDAFVIVLLLVAAHGTYGLARRFGADRTGAVLAGAAFALSGYIACQLKHLAIVSTVVWLPLGLGLLDRGFAPRAPEADTPRMGTDRHGPSPEMPNAREWASTPARRALLFACFGLVFAEQALSGFPQSAYICALVYASFALFTTFAGRGAVGWRAALTMLGGAGAAAALGAAASAIVMLPLSQLGHVSDRAESLGWEWASRLAYWPPNAITFLLPYANGDISNHTYVGPPFFWEDYGYVGIATFLLAIYGALRDRRRPVIAFTIVMTLLAYAIVLGPATPVYRIVYLIVPGMRLFRFPTRFLIVVELGLALLAAIGLTRLARDLQARWRMRARLACAIAVGICAGTAIDLFIHQPRQNPMVPADSWLAPPASVGVLQRDTAQPRTFTPRHRELHRRAFLQARGWANVEPYFELRDVLQPNTGGGFWNTPSADCYAGIAARWYVDTWGDHNREGVLMWRLTAIDYANGVINLHPSIARVLGAYGVTHLLTPYPQAGTSLPFVGHEGNAYVYRIDGASRVRFVAAARRVSNEHEAAAGLLDPSFDPDREVLLHDAPEGAIHASDGTTAVTGRGRAAIIREDARQMTIDVDAPADGFLLLADTYYPGWTAQVDGREAPIYRANISVRAVAVAAGHHEVRFVYEPPGLVRGLTISLAACAALLAWTGAAAFAVRRASR